MYDLLDRITANRIVKPKYDQMVVKALNNTSDSIVSYFRNNYKSDVASRYSPYQDAINKIIFSIQHGTPIEDFEPGMKVRIEITESFNTSSLNIAGDLAGFVPVLGEVYTLVDFLSDENTDLSKLGSAFISAITEKDIAKLTPYADDLGKLGKFSNAVNLAGLLSDAFNWNSQDNIKQQISIYVQQGQGASYMYQAIVSDDLSFKEMASSFTGTVIRPEDKILNILYK